MERETQNRPCAWMLAGILVIVMAMSASVFPKTAYADDAALSDLQTQIESTAADYDTATAKVAQLQQQIQDNKARIAEITAQLPAQQERSSDAVKALYVLQQEGYGMFQMILGSEDIGEFLQRLEYVDCIEKHNVAQLEKLNSLKTELEQNQQDLDEAAKQADVEADRAQKALADAQAARQLAEEQAVAAAAAQAADTASVQASSTAQGQDSQNPVSPATEESGSDAGLNGTVSSGDVNWSSDKAAFVAEWTGRINNYLSGSPLAGEGQTFAEAAWDYGVDPRWSPAIAYVESSLGAYCFRPHNAWGWGSSSWGSWDEAIYAHVGGLSRGYGSTLTYAAACKYCPPNADFWYNKCLAQMNSI